MKKLPAILLVTFLFSKSFGQMAEIGYNTADVGAEFQWYKDGKFLGLHFAYNAKLHHSVHGEIGYYMAGDPTAVYYANQDKGGMGLGVGYRYYTMLRPHAFFIGIKANLFTNKIVLLGTQDPETHTSKIFVPALETGYMILINDLFFISPGISIGYKTNLESILSQDEKKAVVLLGISTGFKF
jgi:hypothetical protein